MIDLSRLGGIVSPEIRISAVILAAGTSSRMGGPFKLLLDFAGEPMIRRTVRNVLAIAPAETIVVTGHRAPDVEAALANLPIRFVRNPDHAQGQPTSVAAGVRALTVYCDAVMIALGDQPLIRPEHFRVLADGYAAMERGSILVPYHQGKRGNPILFAARHIPSVSTGDLNMGCRRLVDTHPDDVARIEVGDDVYTVDCDTPGDYERLVARAEDVPA